MDYMTTDQVLELVRKSIERKKIVSVSCRIGVDEVDDLSEILNARCLRQTGKMTIEIDYDPPPPAMELHPKVIAHRKLQATS